MESKKVYELLVDYLSERLDIKNLNKETQLDEAANFDSLFVVELILFIEETFDVEIPEEYYGMDNFSTIPKIMGIIKNSVQK